MAASDRHSQDPDGPGRESKYWAFISYSHVDEAWAKWLHRALETYRVPKRLTRLKGAANVVPRRLLPIFRDSDELAGSSNLGARLEGALRASRALIVICSPHSAQSSWVDQEIRTYQATGRADRVFAVVVDGEPNAADPARECFPPSLRLGSAEPLACDPRADHEGKAKAKLRLIAGLLGLDFDELKRRERQRRIRRAIGLSVAGLTIMSVLAAVLFENMRQTRIGQSRRLAAESQDLAAENPIRALELAILAATTAPTAESAKALSLALTHQLTRTILSHPKLVVSAVFSPNATRVLSCTADGIGRIWNVQTGHLEHSLDSGYAGESGGICIYSPDGSSILTVAGDLDPMLWNAQSGRRISVLRAHSGRVLSGRFSPDGSRIVTAGLDTTVRVWAADTAKPSLLFRGHNSPVGHAFFFPDGLRIVSISTEGHAIVWDASTGDTLARFGDYVPGVEDAVLSPDGSRLLISNYQYGANLWDPRTGAKIEQLTHRTRGAAFSQDSARLILGSGDGRVTVWELEAGSTYVVKELPHSSDVDSVLYSPDGSIVVTGGEQPYIWGSPELGGGAEAELFSLRGHNGGAAVAEFSKDGRLLTFGPRDRTVRVWDLEGGSYKTAFGDRGIWRVTFSADGSTVLTVGEQLQVWRTQTTQLVATIKVPLTSSLPAQLSSNGARVIASCFKSSVCVFDATTGAVLLKLDNVSSFDMALSPDGSIVAALTEENSVELFDVRGGTRIKSLTGKPGDGPKAGRQITFSPNGHFVLVGASVFEGTRVWDAATGQHLVSLDGYKVTFSANSALAVTSRGSTVHVYEPENWRAVRQLTVSSGDIVALALSPDTASLAAGSTEGAITVWDLATGARRLSLTTAPSDGRVLSLQFSSDSERLIAITDHGIYAYHAGDGSEWQVFHHNFGIGNAAAAPDGSMVIATDRGRALMYPLDLHDLLDAARRRLPATSRTLPARSVTNDRPPSVSSTPVEVAPPEEAAAKAMTDTSIQNFVKDYLAVGSSADADRALSFYADRVDYFGKGVVGQDFIRKDKEDYFKRWPKVRHELDGDVTVTDAGAPTRKLVKFRSVYEVENPQRNAHAAGTVENVLEVALVDGTLKIVHQTGIVIPVK